MKEDGYFTVEATCIFSMALYVLLFIIYVGFYWYDRSLLKQDCCRAALYGSSTYEADNRQRYNAAYRRMEEITKDQYMAMTFTYEIEANTQVKVAAAGQVKLPISGLQALAGKKEASMEVQAVSNSVDAVFFIRSCKMGEALLHK